MLHEIEVGDVKIAGEMASLTAIRLMDLWDGVAPVRLGERGEVLVCVDPDLGGNNASLAWLNHGRLPETAILNRAQVKSAPHGTKVMWVSEEPFEDLGAFCRLSPQGNWELVFKSENGEEEVYDWGKQAPDLNWLSAVCASRVLGLPREALLARIQELRASKRTKGPTVKPWTSTENTTTT
jgi:hypothetical protein